MNRTKRQKMFLSVLISNIIREIIVSALPTLSVKKEYENDKTR